MIIDFKPTNGGGGGGGGDMSNYYTKAQVNALIEDFVTETTDDLVNYYLKSDTYAKGEVDSLIGAVSGFSYEIAQSTASVVDPQSNVLYLIGPDQTVSGDQYEEYVYSNNEWVKIGDTSIDLAGYVTTSDLNTALANYVTSTSLANTLAGYASLETISTVAISGSYNDLEDKLVAGEGIVIGAGNVISATGATTTLATVATTGDYDDLINKPVIPVVPELSTVATTGSYNDLTDKPTIPVVPELSTVATTGSYNDLTDKPVIPVVPELSTVATTGDYNDLTNTPSIPDAVSGVNDGTNWTSITIGNTTAAIPAGGGGVAQQQADWTEDDTTDVTYIKNKPVLSTVATSGSYNDLTDKPSIPVVPELATVATSGSYNDLTDKPSIPVVPELSTVATTGDYDDLTNKPTIPVVPELSTVATTGSYNDLTDTPSIPDAVSGVNDGTNWTSLTIGTTTKAIPGGVDMSDYYTKSQTDALVANFITATTDDLVNYYLKSETYTQTEVDNLIGAVSGFSYEIAQSTSAVVDPQSNVLYLIGPSGSGSDQYEEYVYTNNTWTKIGDTSIDLSDYVTVTMLNTALASYTTTQQLENMLSVYVLASDLASVATSGSYNDLTDKPTVDVTASGNNTFTGYNTFTQTAAMNGGITTSRQESGDTRSYNTSVIGGEVNLNYGGDSSLDNYTVDIQPQFVSVSDDNGNMTEITCNGIQINGNNVVTDDQLATVATSGSYDDLTDKPVIPVVPQLATVATSGSYNDLTDKPSIPVVPTLATVATSGSYNDLSDKLTAGNGVSISNQNVISADSNVVSLTQAQYDALGTNVDPDIIYVITDATAITLSTVATTGSYNDLTDKPSIPVVPTLATVATSGNYNDLTNKPDLTNYALHSDLAMVATTGSYNDLTDKPSMPTGDVTASGNNTLTGNNTFTGYNTFTQTAAMNGGITTSRQESGDTRSYNTNVIGGEVYLNYGGDSSLDEYYVSIQPQVVSVMDDSGNMTEITSNGIQINGNNVVTDDQLATVATSGSYNDLTDKPTIPVLPTLATVATTGAYADLTGTPALATVATSGSYNDLTDKPTIPVLPTLATVATTGAYADLTGTPTLATVATSGAYTDLSGKPTLSTVATSGSYSDLTNKPSIPTVNDSIITVRQGDTTIGTFSLNQSSNKTLTIPASVPEIDLATLSDLELVGVISDIWSVGIQAYMMSHRLYYGGYPITTFGEGYYDITGEYVIPTQTQTEATHCFWIAADNSANSVDVNHSLGYNQKLGRVAMFANEEGSHTFSEEYYEVKNVAYTGSYNDLDDKPSMGTAALVFTLDNNTTVTYNVWIQPSNNA